MPKTTLIRKQVTPTGSIQPYGGGVVPDGWMACDGSPISRSTYSNLFLAIGTSWGVGDGSTTFNLPDLRGQFLRGLDTTGTVDPDGLTRTVGSSQSDEFKEHSHTLSELNKGGGETTATSANITTLSQADAVTGTDLEGGAETRPKNMAVNYMIKVE